jgi:hypothetical protein
MGNPIAKFSRIIGADLLSHLLGMSKKRTSATDLASTCYWYRGEKHVADFFRPKKTGYFLMTLKK